MVSHSPLCQGDPVPRSDLWSGRVLISNSGFTGVWIAQVGSHVSGKTLKSAAVSELGSIKEYLQDSQPVVVLVIVGMGKYNLMNQLAEQNNGECALVNHELTHEGPNQLV